MTATPRIGILGGTLDPVHLGHLDAASAAKRALGLRSVLVVPSRVPPHRDASPGASPYHRFAMAALAVDGLEGFSVSDIELRAPGPSFTSATLERLQAAGLRSDQMFFITGADAFAEIATWHRYPEVLELAHFVVVSRPGRPVGEILSLLPELAARMRPGTVEAARASKPAIFLVDAPTSDVSSTDIRRRIHAGKSLHGLVPEAVERHIRRHALYAAQDPANELLVEADHLHGED